MFNKQFNVAKLVNSTCKKVASFSKTHRSEMFYSFAIDADMLCLNSEEAFQETLNEYRNKWLHTSRPLTSLEEMTQEDHLSDDFFLNTLLPMILKKDVITDNEKLDELNKNRLNKRNDGFRYEDPTELKSFKSNTGDWKYQGFSSYTSGFSQKLYQEHYDAAADSEDGHAPNTKYAIAMSELVEELKKLNPFHVLNTTQDFTITWVDHNY